MTTPSELRDKLIEDYNSTAVRLQELRGAISACDLLINNEEGEAEEDED